MDNTNAFNTKDKITCLFIIIIFIAAIVLCIIVGRIIFCGPNSGKDSYGHDKADVIVIAENAVRQQLKSPSTAQFCNSSEYSVSRSENEWTVSGWVDAQNSFGATLRSKFTVTISFTDKTHYTVSCSIY